MLQPQSEFSEYAFAALVKVMACHGGAIRVAELRACFGAQLHGTSPKSLGAFAQPLGLLSRPLRLDLPEAGKLVWPCIFRWGSNALVASERVYGQRGMTIGDLAVGA